MTEIERLTMEIATKNKIIEIQQETIEDYRLTIIPLYNERIRRIKEERKNETRSI
jgi:hypothetical protein